MCGWEPTLSRPRWTGRPKSWRKIRRRYFPTNRRRKRRCGEIRRKAGISGRSCAVHARLAIVGAREHPPLMEATMKRQALISRLVAGTALILLGGCAYDDYDRGGYYSGGGG